MYDAVSLSDGAVLQRAVGALRVGVRVRDGRTVLDGLYQAGCLKARMPRAQLADWCDIVMMNTSGGIVGGDALASSFQMQGGARATLAGQAAERFYRAMPGSVASVRTRIEQAEGAMAEWLPQETILFDGCSLDRRLEVELAEGAWFLGVESLVFGRAAMGEQVERAWLRDAVRIRRGGRLVLSDAVRLEGEVSALLRRGSIAAGARAVATVWHVAADAEARVEGLRTALGTPPPLRGRGVLECGVSAWDGMVVARILAADGAILRDAVVAALRVLRDDRPLPRVWLC